MNYKGFNELIDFYGFYGIELQDNIALFDKEDLEIVSKYRWYKTKRGYVETTTKNPRILLHHLLMGKPEKCMMIDHINRSKIDNRRYNLRVVNSRENILNSKLRKDNTSGYKGVYWDESKKKWMATIFLDGKFKFMKRFSDKIEAIDYREKLQSKYY